MTIGFSKRTLLHGVN